MSTADDSIKYSPHRINSAAGEQNAAGQGVGSAERASGQCNFPTTQPAPAAPMPRTVKRYSLMCGAMVEPFNPLDGVPTGTWVEYSDYERLERELAEKEAALKDANWRADTEAAARDENVAGWMRKEREQRERAERAEAALASYNELADYVMGYWPVGLCCDGPIAAVRNVVDRMVKAEAALAVTKAFSETPDWQRDGLLAIGNELIRLRAALAAARPSAEAVKKAEVFAEQRHPYDIDRKQGYTTIALIARELLRLDALGKKP